MGIPPPDSSTKPSRVLDTVTIRFCGDSGDGMQLSGGEFSRASAFAGNDLRTFPDFPAEIRAPAGTLAGVSGFQIQFSSQPVYTPGDRPDVLVAMNPAALRSNLADLRPGGTLIVNTGAFVAGNLAKAGYLANPIEDGSLDAFVVHGVDISKLTEAALHGSGLSTKEIARSKNMFALGLMLWLYQRPTEPILRHLQQRFAKKPEILAANEKVLLAGHAFGETAELFAGTYVVPPARIAPGRYRNVSGNQALAMGLIAAAKLSGLKGFLGSYPITPASDILHELSRHKNFGFTTFQAEDEIAAVSSAIGAAFGGNLGITTSSGPGIALKQEAINLAVMAELPLLVIDVQRGGPSTGLPTKTEQADLLQVLFGRNGESPLPVIAPATPSECFNAALEAVRIAVRYMTPVILLSDGSLANGQEPWKIPEIADLKPIDAPKRTKAEGFLPYERDNTTLARSWVAPGTPGLEHRIGGLEKDFLTGSVSYDPENHEKMVRVRAEKVRRVAQDYAPLEVEGPPDGRLLVVGWGSTYGAIRAAAAQLRSRGLPVSHVHLRNLNPLPMDLGGILQRFEKVVVPELNLGQLSIILRARYLVDAVGINAVKGKPLQVGDLAARIEEALS
ncbi:2-oxoacid:acceptor oxidoreductase subunit alpha [Vulgatibacter incomptus]|uniref:2-oxoglutarate oxidoreductase, alpha subunit n=1 Tax=Vulgatibacter incomptus TaxID=1391653 RepID=A0A0K1P9B7_9BACT|nr:2-oxoacid:acceptor oxidoreductase subunit alpha [Vulgatibacter incomptus]AKU89694.1 2-oxoglutarate oxidoreductase, alpha subunit [Vulgatibacter incomptus]